MVGGQTEMGMSQPAPFNTFSHASRLAGPDNRFVSINNDTIYSIAQVDVSGGPVLLRVPDSAGRYYVLQFVDAWTNNFAYVGRRATGTEAGTFLLAPPGWQAKVPAGTQVIEFPTTAGTIVGAGRVTVRPTLAPCRPCRTGCPWNRPAGRRRCRASRPRPPSPPGWPSSSRCGPGCRPSRRPGLTRPTRSGSPRSAC